MGYRSVVHSLIYGTKEQLDVFITTHTLILSSQVFNHFKESLTRYSFKSTNNDEGEEREYHVLDLYGDRWKWYEIYSDVMSWHDLLTKAEEDGLMTEFVRIGEGAGDSLDVQIERTDNSITLLGVSSPQIYDEIPDEKIDMPIFG